RPAPLVARGEAHHGEEPGLERGAAGIARAAIENLEVAHLQNLLGAVPVAPAARQRPAPGVRMQLHQLLAQGGWMVGQGMGGPGCVVADWSLLTRIRMTRKPDCSEPRATRAGRSSTRGKLNVPRDP